MGQFAPFNYMAIDQAATATKGANQQMAFNEENQGIVRKNAIQNDQLKGLEIMANLKDHLTPENWTVAREAMIKGGAFKPELMPEQYDEKWLQGVQKKAASTLSKITMRTGPNTAEDRLYKNGEEIERGAAFDPNAGKKKAAGSGGGGSFKAADANSIRSAAAGIFGGTYDPATGSFKALQKGTEAKVNAISAAAQQIYMKGVNDGAQVPHDEAVRQAARKLKIEIPNLIDPNEASTEDKFPPAAMQYLTEGQETPFKNGQVWKLENGQPVRVR